MKIRATQVVAIPTAVALAATGVILAASPSFATWTAPGTPGQSTVDGSNTGQQQGYWSDFSGGVSARPYVQTLTRTDGATVTSLITGGTASAPSTNAGDVTAVVSPVNLCGPTGDAASGSCYTTPNRVSVVLGVDQGGTDGTDLAQATTPVTSDTVFDMVIQLNSLGAPLRWTWGNAELQHWSTSGLGTAGASIHVRFRPSITPGVDNEPFGCSATPITSCDIPQADGSYLGANLLLSLDDTLDPELTGAAFFSQGAVLGYLTPGHDRSHPSLDMQIASAHLNSDGGAQTGRLQALLPAAALERIYGVLPADATTLFRIARSGDSGTQGTPTYTEWTAGSQGSDGLLVDVPGITFSAPTYVTTSTNAKPSVSLSVASKGTGKKKRVVSRTLTVKTPNACKPAKKGKPKKAACVTSVYLLGNSRVSSSYTTLISKKTPKATNYPLKFSATRLAKGAKVIVVIKQGSKTLSTGLVSVTK